MELRNLTEQNVEALKAQLEAMKVKNPALDYRFFDQDGVELLDSQPSNKQIFEKLESLERQLNLIFDGHVLINGSFQEIAVTNNEFNKD